MSEEKKIFDKKCVHFMWSDELWCKEGFYSDSISLLMRYVESNESVYKGYVRNDDENGASPFVRCAQHYEAYKFFYYDPLYEIKWAWKQDKQIQARSKGSTRNEWMNMEHPGWLDTYEYRVKPDDRFKLLYHTDTDKLELVSVDVWTEDEETKCIGTREECVNYMTEHYCKKCSKQKIVHVYDNCTGFIAKKKWRPFKDIDELKQAWEKKFGPLVHPELFEHMIWVRSKSNTTSTFLITHFCGNVGVVHIYSSLDTSLEQLFDDYTFLDGTPCGVEE